MYLGGEKSWTNGRIFRDRFMWTRIHWPPVSRRYLETDFRDKHLDPGGKTADI